jgi:hypothetical protein
MFVYSADSSVSVTSEGWVEVEEDEVKNSDPRSAVGINFRAEAERINPCRRYYRYPPSIAVSIRGSRSYVSNATVLCPVSWPNYLVCRYYAAGDAWLWRVLYRNAHGGRV